MTICRRAKDFNYAGGFLDDGFVRERELLRDEAQEYVRGLEAKDLQFRESHKEN